VRKQFSRVEGAMHNVHAGHCQWGGQIKHPLSSIKTLSIDLDNDVIVDGHLWHVPRYVRRIARWRRPICPYANFVVFFNQGLEVNIRKSPFANDRASHSGDTDVEKLVAICPRNLASVFIVIFTE
jgi:hypothetical protein